MVVNPLVKRHFSLLKDAAAFALPPLSRPTDQPTLFPFNLRLLRKSCLLKGQEDVPVSGRFPFDLHNLTNGICEVNVS